MAMTMATLIRRFCITTCFAVASGQTLSGEALNCLLVNKVSDAGELRKLTDGQIENGLCMISKQAVVAIAAHNSLLQEVCVQASANLMKEFYRRFPRRDANEVTGRC